MNPKLITTHVEASISTDTHQPLYHLDPRWTALRPMATRSCARRGSHHQGVRAFDDDCSTIAQWEDWTQMSFPESGNYIVPGALLPVEMDCEIDSGVYLEPNVWVEHQLDA